MGAVHVVVASPLLQRRFVYINGYSTNWNLANTDYAYTIRLFFLSYITTVTIETRTITAFAAMVPAQVIVMVPKMGDAALNMVWNNTHINTRPFPDIL